MSRSSDVLKDDNHGGGKARKTGKEGEDRAQEYLEGLGYRTLARNWKKRWAELDIVMLDPYEPALVFVEVKTERQLRGIDPTSAVDRGKLQRVRRSARLFLKDLGGDHRLPEYCRIDVVAVTLEENRIEHYRAVDFELQV